VGRQAELLELLGNFKRGVLITSASGDTGVGTTALARRLAFAMADDFLDGCLEIDLRGADPIVEKPLDPEEAQRRLLRPFYPYTELPNNAKELNKLYRSTFADREVLLLLDNIASGSQVRKLLPRKSSAAIVTSKHTELSMNWSKLYHLELGGLQPGEAQHLLQRVSQYKKTDTKGIWAKLAKRFDFIPLALRVGASLMKDPFNQGPHAVNRDFPKIHQSLVALHGENAPNLGVDTSLDMIYSALDSEMRARYENLAVFPGPITQAAAAAVWDIDAKDADKTLVTLTRHNLLEYRPTTYTYMMHDLVRQHAQELLLGQMKQTDITVARYAHYILQQARQANAMYKSDGSLAADGLLHFAKLWPDLWKAWHRMNGTDAGWLQPQQTARWLCDFPLQVLPVLNVTRPPAERIIIMERTLEIAQELNDETVELLAVSELGHLYAAQQDTETAMGHHEHHLKLAFKLHDRRQEAEALMYIGQACAISGEYTRAQETWRQAIALFAIIDEERAEEIRIWLAVLEEKLNSPAE